MTAGKLTRWVFYGLIISVAALAIAGTQFFQDRNISLSRDFPTQVLDRQQALDISQRFGLGRSVLNAPDPNQPIQVATYQTFEFVYTVGKTPIKTGGAIRISMRHVSHWSTAQTTNPNAPGYVTVSAPDGVSIAAKTWPEFKAAQDLFLVMFPWQQVIQISVTQGQLSSGQSIVIRYGDREAGSTGTQVQATQEKNFAFRTFVDPKGTGLFLPTLKDIQVSIVGGNATQLMVVLPSDAKVNLPVTATVRAEDKFGNPVPNFSGSVALQLLNLEDPSPIKVDFKPQDRGVKQLAYTFKNPGVQRLTVSSGSLNAISNPILIKQKVTPQESMILWGDIHGHTLLSDGRGTVKEFYDFCGQIAALDICAITDHAYMLTDKEWNEIQQAADRYYEPGKMVTLSAFEWSGMTAVGGDHNVYCLEKPCPIYRSRSYYDYRNQEIYHGKQSWINHVEDLHLTLLNQHQPGKILSIAHYGGRPANPAWHNPQVERLIEVFSEHRRSEGWIARFLAKDYRLGIVAGSDDHLGRPGYGFLHNILKPTVKEIEVNAGLVAVLAPERTREAVFQALFDRHVYATTGDRILLNVEMDGHLMGSEYSPNVAPVLKIAATGTTKINAIQILKDGKKVHEFRPNTDFGQWTWQDPAFNRDKTSAYWVKVIQTNNEIAISSPIWTN